MFATQHRPLVGGEQGSAPEFRFYNDMMKWCSTLFAEGPQYQCNRSASAEKRCSSRERRRSHLTERKGARWRLHLKDAAGGPHGSDATGKVLCRIAVPDRAMSHAAVVRIREPHVTGARQATASENVISTTHQGEGRQSRRQE
jgi:hypothetical protein